MFRFFIKKLREAVQVSEATLFRKQRELPLLPHRRYLPALFGG
jgi:hypothetical protein